MLLLFGVRLLLGVTPGFGSTLSSSIVWLMAGISLVVGWFVFGMFCEPGKDEDTVVWQGVGACLFTGVVGVFTLFIFQELALWASAQTISGGGRLKALLAILKVIGGSYRIAFDESQGLWMTLGAIPCEELVKLLPAVGFGTDWGVSPRRRALGRDTLFITDGRSAALKGGPLKTSSPSHPDFRVEVPEFDPRIRGFELPIDARLLLVALFIPKTTFTRYHVALEPGSRTSEWRSVSVMLLNPTYLKMGAAWGKG